MRGGGKRVTLCSKPAGER